MRWSTNWLKFCSYLVPLLLSLGTFVQRTLSASFRRSYYFRLKWTANVPLKTQSLATTSCDSKRQWHIYLCRPDFQRSSIPGGTSTETTIRQLLQSFRFLHSPEPMEIDGYVTGNYKVDLYGEHETTWAIGNWGKALPYKDSVDSSLLGRQRLHSNQWFRRRGRQSMWWSGGVQDWTGQSRGTCY